MNNFENQLDEIRIKLYEETKEMAKEEIIRHVNTHANKIAKEFGIIIETSGSENYFYTKSLQSAAIATQNK